MVEPTAGDVVHGAADADSREASGSARIEPTVPAVASWSLGQCLAVGAGEELRGALRGRVESTDPGTPVVTLALEPHAGAAAPAAPSPPP